MQEFYGTKRVAALPMTRLAYNDYRGWQLPRDENGADDGYLVEYKHGGKGNHPDHVGYISWSPKAQFDAAHQPTSAMSFGHAIAALKEGYRVARSGWNGKGMFIYLQKGSYDVPPDGSVPHQVGGVPFPLFDDGDHGTTTRMPCMCMRAADGSIVTGWLASQTDILAEDWTILAD
ncbi:Hypothetical protein NGAL_HAMBI2605_59280 [Neorhizobium galegae bv. orientalis]|nr:Hypothetical protein NGAL_HAMBI2605_59280 [Neorhizobium galegae bv. orientalis]